MEKRQFTRIPAGGQVSLRCGSIEATGELLDISLNGVLVRCNMLVPVGEQVRLTLQLRDLPAGTSIALSGTVVRMGFGTLAATFQDVDDISLRRLRLWVEGHHPDPDALNREIEQLSPEGE